MNTVKDRVVRILEILSEYNRIKVKFLAELMSVSHVTIYRDIDNLVKHGVVSRIHGYVTLDGADSTGKRMADHYLIKRKIAKAAAQIVEDGEIIMIESGSCCTMFAEELVLARKNITIITNSLYILNYLRTMQNIKITLLGGYFLPDSQVMIGPMTKSCVSEVYSQKYFLGTDGFSPMHGFTCRDHLRAETAAELANHAEKVFILTEAAKFKKRGSYNLIPYSRLSGVFTDDGIPNEAETALVKNNVKVYKVPAAEEKLVWRRFPGQMPVLYKEKS